MRVILQSSPDPSLFYLFSDLISKSRNKVLVCSMTEGGGDSKIQQHPRGDRGYWEERIKGKHWSRCNI